MGGVDGARGRGDVGWRWWLVGGPRYDGTTPSWALTDENTTKKWEWGEREKRRNDLLFYLESSSAGAGLRTAVVDLTQEQRGGLVVGAPCVNGLSGMAPASLERRQLYMRVVGYVGERSEVGGRWQGVHKCSKWVRVAAVS